VWNLARRSEYFGLPPLSLTSVDLGQVMDRVKFVIDRIHHHDSVERFCSLGAKILFGLPQFQNDHEVSLDGKRISAKSWIIATGSSPIIPPLEGLANVPFWTNENIFLQRMLPSRLVVLGGGPIGLEIAQAFSRLGSEVTVIEFFDQILGPEDRDLADILRERLEYEGVRILTERKAVRMNVKARHCVSS
jgi:pyruvate/2-oxoglutarate dehydrogenase complex dihydrolipoamide dehydrogenase (E3) component